MPVPTATAAVAAQTATADTADTVAAVGPICARRPLSHLLVVVVVPVQGEKLRCGLLRGGGLGGSRSVTQRHGGAFGEGLEVLRKQVTRLEKKVKGVRCTYTSWCYLFDDVHAMRIVPLTSRASCAGIGFLLGSAGSPGPNLCCLRSACPIRYCISRWRRRQYPL